MPPGSGAALNFCRGSATVSGRDLLVRSSDEPAHVSRLIARPVE